MYYPIDLCESYVKGHILSLVFAERHFVNFTRFSLPTVFSWTELTLLFCNEKFVSFNKITVR